MLPIQQRRARPKSRHPVSRPWRGSSSRSPHRRVLHHSSLFHLGLVAVIAVVGCSANQRPDLGQLYDQAASYHAPDRNPIVVIPGITGSRLIESASGRIVWGAFTGNSAKPKRPADARLIAHPMEKGRALDQLRDSVVPSGVLDTLDIRLLGIPVQLRAYVEILRTLGVGGYRDQGLSGAIDYGNDHFTCFQFAYDWRRDLVESARELHYFLEEKKRYVNDETDRRFGASNPSLRFDVVAHSMGALVLRYYLRYGTADLPADGTLPELTWEGTRLIERVVLVGPPNLGSLKAAKQLIDGRRYRFFANYPGALLGTFPSGYQLLPRTPAVTRPDGSAVDMFDVGVWEDEEWGLLDPDQDYVLQALLPHLESRAQRREVALDHLRKVLDRARSMSQALDQRASPPVDTEIFLLAGDAELTPQTAIVRDGRLEFSLESAGDGVVLRSSALADLRSNESWQPTLLSPIDWRQVVFLFEDHLGLTRSPAFTDNVLYWLLEDPRIH